MKIWTCDYDWHGGYGAFVEYRILCIAETKEEALAMAKERAGEPSSRDEDWTITEIDPSKKESYYISSRCS